MRTILRSPGTRALRRGVALAGALLLGAAAPAAAASGSPSTAPSTARSRSPSAGAPGGTPAAATSAGTSFLTATTLAPGQRASVSASTGDYLYWAFPAAEGRTPALTVTVTLPAAADRHGPQTWTAEVFDGLRRRQACTAGHQSATAAASATSLTVDCTLRRIRSWAEPWSGDPLPGTYYIRLSLADAPAQDLGLPARADLTLAASGSADDAQPEGGSLKVPLAPPVNAGATLAPTATAVPTAAPSPSAGASAGASGIRVVAAAPAARIAHWYSDLFSQWNSRWGWTLAGGALAALAGVGGYTLTRHPRGGRRPPGYRPGPQPQHGTPAERYQPVGAERDY
ncbi:hypothetical protein GCM10009665_35930 [Kitasatospora nipponensis]|uniref:Peptidase n=1 Tax=Kitasatospora nipponensis TaxID=258049 RepID=A0ABN1WC16_9ACTN